MLFPGATELVLLALVVAMVFTWRAARRSKRRRLLEEEELRRQRTLAAPARAQVTPTARSCTPVISRPGRNASSGESSSASNRAAA